LKNIFKYSTTKTIVNDNSFTDGQDILFFSVWNDRINYTKTLVRHYLGNNGHICGVCNGANADTDNSDNRRSQKEVGNTEEFGNTDKRYLCNVGI